MPCPKFRLKPAAFDPCQQPHYNRIGCSGTGVTGDVGVCGATGAPPDTPTHVVSMVGEIWFEARNGVEEFNITGAPLTVPLEGQLPTNFTTTHPGMFDMPSPGRLRYLGTTTVMCKIMYASSLRQTTGTNIPFEFQMRRNGLEVPGATTKLSLGANDEYSTYGYHKLTELTYGDYVSLFVVNLAPDSGLGVFNLNITISC